MTILIFSWRDIRHPKAGGAEQVIHEHVKGWVKAGHSVIHFSSKMPGLLDSETIDGIKFVRSGYQYLGVQIAGFFYYIKNKKNIDLVIDEFHGVPFFTPLFVRKPRLAIIQEVAGEVWFLNPLRFPINLIIGLIGYIGEPFIFLFYRNTKFMTGSESAKNAVEGFGIPRKNITVIPHGVVTLRQQATGYRLQERNNKTITFLGVLSKDKGIEDAIKCFKILENKNCQFWVIGKPETKEYGEYIFNLTKKLGLEKKVKFFGFVPQSKKFELLSKSHIFVNPSVHEGWGLVNIEANSVGVPVVSYNNAGLVDSVKNGVSGIICTENTPENMAENVEDLLHDKKKYQKLTRGAISWSKNFSWEKSRKLSLKLINSLK